MISHPNHANDVASRIFDRRFTASTWTSILRGELSWNQVESQSSRCLHIQDRSGIRRRHDRTCTFSCHCFSRSFRWDARATHLIPADEIYDDGKERRVLDPQRYELSRGYLRDIVVQLPFRRITIANEKQPNFVTLEQLNEDGTTSLYAVFFEAERDLSRKRRIVLRIQSAYVLDNGLTRRQEKAGKVGFATLLRATYLGKRIRG